MSYLTPRKIAEITGGEFMGDETARSIRVFGAVRDNRDVKPGNLFVCIRGARVDGHSFANDAFESGAACCLAERPIPEAKGPYVLVASTQKAIMKLGGYYRSLFKIPIIGITGSVGKTTTKEMAAAVLSAKFSVLKTPENMNNELGVPLTLLSLDESHEAAVIEMGISDFGEMSRLAEMVRPSICIITKIGYSHIETLGSLNGVLKAKTEVFAYMSTGGTAVLNGDDELLWGYNPSMHKVTFGFDVRNDIRAENVRAEGTEKVVLDIVSDEGRFTVSIPSYGSHLATVSLAAASAGRLLGLSDDDIVRGLLSYVPVGGRANVTDTGCITVIDDCYNANPNSVMAALTSLSELPKRRVAILGDMLELGIQSDQMHREIGAFAVQSGVDCLICCGDKAAFIFEGYTSAGGDSGHYYPAKAELIAAIPDYLKKEDVVLLKASHGMKFEELIPFLNKFSIS